MNPSYQCLLTDVARYLFRNRHGTQGQPPEEPELAPAAEEALRDLTARAASDLNIPHCSAREGLIHAARLHSAPVCQILLKVAAQLHLQSQKNAVGI